MRLVLGRSDMAATLAARQVDVAGRFGKDQELGRMAAALDVATARRSTLTSGPSAKAGLVSGPGPAPDLLAALTPRETEVLRRIAAGQNTKKMAAEMKVTTETLQNGGG